MRDMQLMQLMQMSGGSLTAAVCLLGLFALALFRRHVITHWGLFRLAYISLALSIALPPLLFCWLQADSVNVNPSSGQDVFPGRFLFTFLSAAVAPTCLALSIFFGFGSILPRETTSRTPPPPVKHPLD